MVCTRKENHQEDAKLLGTKVKESSPCYRGACSGRRRIQQVCGQREALEQRSGRCSAFCGRNERDEEAAALRKSQVSADQVSEDTQQKLSELEDAK